MRQRFKRGQTILQIDGAGHCGTITWRATADPKLVAVRYCSDYQTFDWVDADKTINCPREIDTCDICTKTLATRTLAIRTLANRNHVH